MTKRRKRFISISKSAAWTNASLVRLVPAFAVLILVGLWTASAAAGREDAGAFLTDLNSEAVALLKNDTLSGEQKVQTFVVLIERSFDVIKIGKFVLGRNWKRASPEQRDAFIDVFTKVNIQRFLPFFTRYADQKFEVTKVRRDDSNPRLFFVTSEVGQGDSPPAEIEWRTLQDDSRFRILDVKAEGVSMALTLRNEYSSVVKSQGVDGLIEQLQSKVVDNSILLPD